MTRIIATLPPYRLPPPDPPPLLAPVHCALGRLQRVRRPRHLRVLCHGHGRRRCGKGGGEEGNGASSRPSSWARFVAEDPSRPPWPACPSDGWASGVDRLSSLPNGSPAGLVPNNKTFIQGAKGCSKVFAYETHGPYQHGEGFQTKNSYALLNPFDLAQPPPMGSSVGTTGAECPGTYASEFGGVAMCSFESLTPTLAPDHWALHADPMRQRNYAVDNFVTAVANSSWPASFNTSGAAPLQAKLYFALLSQALLLKSMVEGRRSYNAWGTLIWQLNEIWPTGAEERAEGAPLFAGASRAALDPLLSPAPSLAGGWGSIEYGTADFTPGQVEGGRCGRALGVNRSALEKHRPLPRALAQVEAAALLPAPLHLPRPPHRRLQRQPCVRALRRRLRALRGHCFALRAAPRLGRRLPAVVLRCVAPARGRRLDVVLRQHLRARHAAALHSVVGAAPHGGVRGRWLRLHAAAGSHARGRLARCRQLRALHRAVPPRAAAGDSVGKRRLAECERHRAHHHHDLRDCALCDADDARKRSLLR